MAQSPSRKKALRSTIPESSSPRLNVSPSASEPPNATQPGNAALKSPYLRPLSSNNSSNSSSQNHQGDLTSDRSPSRQPALTQHLYSPVRAGSISGQPWSTQITSTGGLSVPAGVPLTSAAASSTDRPDRSSLSIQKTLHSSASAHTGPAAPVTAAVVNPVVVERSAAAPSLNNAESATTISPERAPSIQMPPVLPERQALRPPPDPDNGSKRQFLPSETRNSIQSRSDEDNMMARPPKQARLEHSTGQTPTRHSPELPIPENSTTIYGPPLSRPPARLGPGQHTTEAPLNHHPMGLRETFSAAHTQTGRETFRRDLVDSEGPPAPRLEDIKIDLSPIIKPRRLDRDDGISRESVQETPMNALDAAAPMSPLANHFSDRHQSRPATPVDYVASARTETSVATPRAHLSPHSGNRSSVHSTPSIGSQKAGEDILPHKSSSPVPEFPIYVCEWEGCQAELHDAHTLRRHVRKRHLKNQTSCLWADCPRSMKRFQPEELREHMQTEHIHPLAVKYGNSRAFPGNGKADLCS